jgi:hypothetical protein
VSEVRYVDARDPTEKRIAALEAEVERLTAALRAVVRIRERDTAGSVGRALGWKDEAAQVARAALPTEGGE